MTMRANSTVHVGMKAEDATMRAARALADRVAQAAAAEAPSRCPQCGCPIGISHEGVVVCTRGCELAGKPVRLSDHPPAGAPSASALGFEDWDESKHPRNPHGEFATSGEAKAEADRQIDKANERITKLDSSRWHAAATALSKRADAATKSGSHGAAYVAHRVAGDVHSNLAEVSSGARRYEHQQAAARHERAAASHLAHLDTKGRRPTLHLDPATGATVYGVKDTKGTKGHG